MGHRANLVVVTAGGVELYYSHWRANLLDRDLFWGPEHATRLARAQRSALEGATWLDEVWAEGGAVLDHVHRVLLWYGGEDIELEIPRRRLVLHLMRACWEGWDVRWAGEGIVDLVRYLGLPDDLVLLERATEPRSEPLDLSPPAMPDAANCVMTIVDQGSYRVLPLEEDPRYWLELGPAFLPALRRAPGLERLDWSEWSSAFPLGGLHVDFDRGAAGFWLAPVAADAAARSRRALPGLACEFWRDAYERHLELAGGRLSLPRDDPSRHLEAVRTGLLADDHDRSIVMQTSIAALEREGASTSDVNPFALRDDPVELSLALRNELLNRAVAQWEHRRRSSHGT